MTNEPINVRVARALGLRVEQDASGQFWRYEHWDCMIDALVWSQVPDYLHDTNFLWSVLESNRLCSLFYSDGHVGIRRTGARPSEEVEGDFLAEAVLLWLIAAKEAEIKINGLP